MQLRRISFFLGFYFLKDSIVVSDFFFAISAGCLIAEVGFFFVMGVWQETEQKRTAASKRKSKG